MRDIERKFPDYAKLIEPRPATIADIQKALRQGEAMVAFYSGEKRTYAWGVSSHGAPAMAVADLDKRGLAASVARIRKALDPNAATLDDIPAFDVVEAHKLYAALLQPTEAAWNQATSLFVVPDGALGQLPLALLVTAPTSLATTDADGVMFSRYRSVPFLARKAGVTQLPSVASLGALRALPTSSGQRRPFVGFGDPWFSKEQAAEAQQEAATQVAGLTTRGIRLRSAPKGDASFTAELAQLPRLADTADEVRSVAAALRADPAQAVFVGAKASKSAVKSMDLSNARIVMFATHGLVPGDLSGLNQPALALSSPDVTGNPADGLLTVEDILSLKLNADWVVLSACNTAAAQGAGAEAVSGLGRAFFYAGTRALLVSNWPVETVSARSLTTDLFRRQVENSALSRAEALRQAELALIDGPGPAGPDGKQLFAYAHPIFWAPFSLVGDGGASVVR
jgi:CHAT domain-containing protein